MITSHMCVNDSVINRFLGPGHFNFESGKTPFIHDIECPAGTGMTTSMSHENIQYY